MKNLILLLVSLAILPGAIFAQSCLPEGIIFSTQGQIDSFQVNYPGCTEIDGDVTISGEAIVNLTGLNVITNIGGDIYISNTIALTELNGLENLNSIDGDLYIQSNETLVSLTGLSNLSSIGSSIGISQNPSLSSLIGLGNIPAIDGNLYIIENESLINMEGLESLSQVNGSFFSIEYNENLEDLSGLEALVSIGADFIIKGNFSLTSLSGLNNLTNIQGYFNISNNPLLGSLDALINLTYVGSLLYIYNNESITRLTGLEGLQIIGDGITIDNNDNLNDLDGLINITTVGGGEIYIINNYRLISLAGLANIDAASISYLSVHTNLPLSDCAVQSICDYLAIPNSSTNIHDNDPGCNSREEVEAACEVGIDESSVIGRQSSVKIYPNPSSTIITIELPGPAPQFQISIFNPSGMEVITQQASGSSTDLNIRSLPGGVYFIRITDEKELFFGKFVKIDQ